MNLRDLDPYAKAVIGAAVTAAAAYAASVSAHDTLTFTVATTLTAFVVALAANWALPGVALVKELANGVAAGSAAFLATYGHASTQQLWIATIVAAVVGSGFVLGTSNTGRKPVAAKGL